MFAVIKFVQVEKWDYTKGTCWWILLSRCNFSNRGTRLAEFLTNGDPQGNLNKSVKELEEYDPKAIELCRNLATHYSKQLFEIYGNKEDPFFLLAWHYVIGSTAKQIHSQM